MSAADKSSAADPAGDHGDAVMCFGDVVDIKAVKSLGITRITIEIPANHHVRATGAFYDKQVMIFPVTPEPGARAVPYGVMTLAEFNKMKGSPKPSTPPAPAAALARPAPAVHETPVEPATDRLGGVAPTARPVTDSGLVDDIDTDRVLGGDAPVQASTPNSMFRAPRDDTRPKNYAAQAGILCGHSSFWDLLGAKLEVDIKDADAAAAGLRSLLGIESRSWLNPSSPNYNRQVHSRFVSLVREHESYAYSLAQDA